MQIKIILLEFVTVILILLLSQFRKVTYIVMLCQQQLILLFLMLSTKKFTRHKEMPRSLNSLKENPLKLMMAPEI